MLLLLLRLIQDFDAEQFYSGLQAEEECSMDIQAYVSSKLNLSETEKTSPVQNITDGQVL